MHLFGHKSDKSKDDATQTQPGPEASGAAAPATQQGQYRPVFLMVHASPKFPAHWSLFIPELGDRNEKKGKRIHVKGDVRQGFEMEFIRNYDMRQTRSYPELIEIGRVPANMVQDDTGAHEKDKIPRDDFERLCASVPPPGPSMNSASTGVSLKSCDEYVLWK